MTALPSFSEHRVSLLAAGGPAAGAGSAEHSAAQKEAVRPDRAFSLRETQ